MSIRLILALTTFVAAIPNALAASASKTIETCWQGHDHAGMIRCVGRQAASARANLVATEEAIHRAFEGSKEPLEYIQPAKRAFEDSSESYSNYREKQCQLRELLANMGNGPTVNKLACEAELDLNRANQLKEDQWWLK